jgi:hypothetical protein
VTIWFHTSQVKAPVAHDETQDAGPLRGVVPPAAPLIFGFLADEDLNFIERPTWCHWVTIHLLIAARCEMLAD